VPYYPIVSASAAKGCNFHRSGATCAEVMPARTVSIEINQLLKGLAAVITAAAGLVCKCYASA
jgi:hypothetical protein